MTTPRNNYYNDEMLREVASCQRNFDRDKTINPEQMSIIDEWVGKAPTQCGEHSYNIIKITNLETMLDLSKLLATTNVENVVAMKTEDIVFQPQMLGYVCYVYTASVSMVAPDFHVGFSAGLCAARATTLGLKTGFTRCGPVLEQAWPEWLLKWDLDPVNHKSFKFALGVGHGTDDQHYAWSPYREGHLHEHNSPNFPIIDTIS